MSGTEDLTPLQKEIQELEAKLEAQNSLYDELSKKVEAAEQNKVVQDINSDRKKPNVAPLNTVTNEGLDLAASAAAATASTATADPQRADKLIATGPVFNGTLHPLPIANFVEPEVRNEADGKTGQLFTRIDEFVAKVEVEKLCVVGRQGFGKTSCALAVTRHLSETHGATVFPAFVSLPNVKNACSEPGALDRYILRHLGLSNSTRRVQTRWYSRLASPQQSPCHELSRCILGERHPSQPRRRWSRF